MSKRNGDLVRSAREHVFELFRSAPEDVRLEYHRFERTSDVVRACKEIVDGSELDDAAREVALLCAWFYDACYATGSDDHGRSLELCLQFLDGQHGRGPTREAVAACFAGADGVKRPSSDAPDPAPAGGEAPCDVLHDGRLVALASKDYVEQAELLRLELERRSGKTFSDVEWTERCIAYFDAHPYRTRFAQLAYGNRRATNLARLQKQLRKGQRELARAGSRGDAKSAESMFYHFTRLHITLFEVADRRTNTMVHVNALMMSIVVALLARRIATDRDLLVPTILLLAVNVAVVFLAVHSMRAPRMAFSTEEARQHETNLLGFMNEKSLSLSEYAEGMDQLVADPAHYQRKVIEALYFGRKMLAERTKALRRTYDVFMYGVAVAMVAFIVMLARR